MTHPILDADLDYRNRGHMWALAGVLEMVPPEKHAEIAAFIVDWDLMRPQWWVRVLMWLVRRRHGHTLLLWMQLEKDHSDIAANLITATADWIRHGKDRTTRDAAGGFNQSEVDHLQGALGQLGAPA